jgi:hypothetical protein
MFSGQDRPSTRRRWRPGFLDVVGTRMPRDARPFTPLLEASSGWLNVLPVPGPVAPVAPAKPVDPAVLGSVTKLDQVGLGSLALADRSAAAAVNLASIFQRHADADAAQTTIAHANQLNASVVTVLGSALGVTTHAAAPAPPAISRLATGI